MINHLDSHIFSYITQSEVELVLSVNQSHQITVHSRDDVKKEIPHNSYRDQTQQQNQIDLLRRQLHSLMEKEKMYKNEITDLKQQLSRR